MLSTLLTSWQKSFSLGARSEPLTLQHPAVCDWHTRAEEIRAVDDKKLKELAEALKQEIAAKRIKVLDAQIESGALAGEPVRRPVGYDLLDTQRLAGLVLAQGMIAQMQTGEGKTLSGAA